MIRRCDGQDREDEGERRGGEDGGRVMKRVKVARAVKEGKVEVDGDEEKVGPVGVRVRFALAERGSGKAHSSTRRFISGSSLPQVVVSAPPVGCHPSPPLSSG